MRYPGDRHVLPLFGPWRWASYMRGKFYWKKYQNARSFFLSHTSKLYQQKQWDVVPKSTAKIDPSNKYNIFPSFIIDQSWSTFQLKNIVLSFYPPFEHHCPFYIYRSVTLSQLELSHFGVTSTKAYRNWVSCEHNTFYNFKRIILKLCMCIFLCLMMCIAFECNPKKNLHDIFRNFVNFGSTSTEAKG